MTKTILITGASSGCGRDTAETLAKEGHRVVASMRAAGDGLFINIGSVLGRVTFPFFGIYGASKFAVEALSGGRRAQPA